MKHLHCILNMYTMNTQRPILVLYLIGEGLPTIGHRQMMKNEIINSRVDEETKEFLKRAAKLAGLDLSSYVISRAKEAAAQDIIRFEQANRILLKEEDFNFAKSVAEAPANVTPKLKSAKKKHLKI